MFNAVNLIDFHRLVDILVDQSAQLINNATKEKSFVFTRHVCGSPFVRSKPTGSHCRSRRPEPSLPHTTGHVEAPGHRRAGEAKRDNSISTHHSHSTG